MLKQASIADAPQIASLNRQFHIEMSNFIWDQEDWIVGEIRAGNYYVLTDEQAVVAALCLHVDKEKAQAVIETIATRSDRQGKGIGRLVITEAIALSIRSGAESLFVDSFCSYGVSGFYEKCGFIRASQVKHYNGHPYYSFTRSLTERICS